MLISSPKEQNSWTLLFPSIRNCNVLPFTVIVPLTYLHVMLPVREENQVCTQCSYESFMTHSCGLSKAGFHTLFPTQNTEYLCPLIPPISPGRSQELTFYFLFHFWALVYISFFSCGFNFNMNLYIYVLIL